MKKNITKASKSAAQAGKETELQKAVAIIEAQNKADQEKAVVMFNDCVQKLAALGYAPRPVLSFDGENTKYGIALKKIK